ncbi:rhoptry protein ROP18 [Besnoitia besnoiti]|uniref:mitogen-activated protein kinase kinase n=1 Tax=Besnoitia besnoiti TaxID=94643 RepID=A0A2A9M5V8_BESBE|nr:rhoptry protein ROP18 [Besnoitia besnoiti]PFH31037.1 rhoptry protein ROP18 [Besnoitia besnoiti]
MSLGMAMRGTHPGAGYMHWGPPSGGATLVHNRLLHDVTGQPYADLHAAFAPTVDTKYHRFLPVSWLEQDTTTPRSDPSHSQSSWIRRVTKSLISRGGGREIENKATQSRRNMRGESLRRGSWGRVTQFFRPRLPALGAQVARRFRSLFSCQNCFSYTIGQLSPSPVVGVSFRPREPGDAIIKQLLLSLASDLGVFDSAPYTTFDKALSEAYWPAGQSLTLKSGWSGTSRTLLRARILGKGGFGLVYLVKDVYTGKEFALKTYIFGTAPTDQTSQIVKEEAISSRALLTARTADEAQERLRLMVASDMLRIPRQSRQRMVTDGPRTKWVLNSFLLLPRAEADLSAILGVITRSALINESSLARFARWHLTAHVIKLAAILQQQQIVHCDIKPENLFVMADGRVLLGDFGSSHKWGETGEALFTKPYTPPEAARRATALTYNYTIDSWQVGLVLCEVWCNKRPLPQTEGALESITCSVPAPVRKLIHDFLRISPDDRLLALHAMQSPEFAEIDAHVTAGIQHLGLTTPSPWS